MKIYDNKIVCQRGESFQINRQVINQDETPYIVPLVLNNPYLCLTVASVSNMQTNRYLRNWWLPFSTVYTESDYIDNFLAKGNIPRFTYSVPFDLSLLTETKGGGDDDKLYPNGWADIDSTPITDIIGYIGDESFAFNLTDQSEDGPYANGPYYNECVFVAPISGTNKTLSYRYCAKLSDGVLTWRKYDFIITFPMTSNETIEWISQNYQYGISLQAGISTEEMCEEIGISYSAVKGKSLEELITDYPTIYDTLKNHEYLLNAIVSDSPLCNVDFAQPILEPTSLTVNTNLKGGILQ